MRKPKYATPESEAFAAELDMQEREHYQTAAEKRAEFKAAWAKRLERPTPSAVPPSELHQHTEAECFEGVQVETRWINNVLGWYEGRMCKVKLLFVAIRPSTNPTAVQR